VRIGVIAIAGSVVLVLGCAIPYAKTTRTELASKIQHEKESTWYYVGSDTNFHYFHQRLARISLIPMPARWYFDYYKLPASEMQLSRTFPRTTASDAAWTGHGDVGVKLFRRDALLTATNPFPWEVSIDYVDALEQDSQGLKQRETGSRN
jgi:hypothetical protein